MSVVGTVEGLWRDPVKSMRGEESDELFAGFAGVYGDRLFAFESSATSKGCMRTARTLGRDIAIRMARASA